LLSFGLHAQNKDEQMIKKFYSEELAHGRCYGWLDTLCRGGHRLSGSVGAANAVKWGKEAMEKAGFDRVFLQECMVPHWVRGPKEKAEIIPSNGKSFEIPVAALGSSVGTGMGPITAEIIEVHSLDEVAKLGKKNIAGKIVFFARPMDPSKINTFEAYGGAVDQRSSGPVIAAKYGAIAIIIRSMNLTEDDYPHTGNTNYVDSIKKIPAAAISTKAATLLDQMLKTDSHIKCRLEMHCETLPDEKSYNVVGEIKGSEHPEEIILVGGHLDSWDLGDGAHDDGAGCVESMEAIRLFIALNIRPKRTIRAVLFMNEENGLRGGKKYAELAKANNEKTIMAIETDEGGFVPRGFSIGKDTSVYLKVLPWRKYFEPYHAAEFVKGGGGADISPLEKDNVPVMSLTPDNQRYFDFHHTPVDKLQAVNKRELEMGAATLGAMIYLLSTYGL
jgi:hypothetical protein